MHFVCQPCANGWSSTVPGEDDMMGAAIDIVDEKTGVGCRQGPDRTRDFYDWLSKSGEKQPETNSIIPVRWPRHPGETAFQN